MIERYRNAALRPLMALSLLLSTPAQAQLGLPPTGCDPMVQSCGSTTPPIIVPPVTTPGGPSCSPGAGGATCAASGPAVLNSGPALNVGAGNPINLMSGNKYQREDDMPALPGALGLELVRHYNSAFSKPNHSAGIIGRGWKLSYETELFVAGTTVQIIQADGARLIFSLDTHDPTRCASGNPADGVVRLDSTAMDAAYTWHWPDGRTLRFNRSGKLTRIQAPSGEVTLLRYGHKGMLTEVIDPQGRMMRLNYALDGALFRGVSSIDTPVGRFSFEYGSPLPETSLLQALALHANLVRVTAPPRRAGVSGQGVVRHYHFEDPSFPTLLSGISVSGKGDDGLPMQRRLTTYLYDSGGKAVLTVKGTPARLQTGADGRVLLPAVLAAGTGIEQVVIDNSVGGQTTLINALGEKTIYRYAVLGGHYRLLEVRGPGCSTCGETNMRFEYDGLGRLVDSTRLDARGGPVSTMRTGFDSRGRISLISRIDYVAGKPTAPQWQERREYAGNGQLPTLVARPSAIAGKEILVSTLRNAFGQPVSVTEEGWTPAAHGKFGMQALKRSTGYFYRLHQGRSLLVRVDGPLANGPRASPVDSDITLLEYDEGGNHVKRLTAPGNIVTEVRQRDSAQRPTAMARSDGARLVQTQLAYSSSGEVLSQHDQGWLLDSKGKPISASALDTPVELRYSALGQLLQVLTHGRSTMRWLYDDAGRPTHRIAPDDSQDAWAYDQESRVMARASYGPGATAGIYDVAYASGGQLDGASVGSGRERAETADATPDIVSRADGSQVRRWFDDFGRVVATRSPERGTRFADYSAADGLVAIYSDTGRLALLERNEQDRVRSVAQGEQDRIIYRYAGAAILEQTRMVAGKVDSQIVWDSDAFGQRTGKRVRIMGGASSPAQIEMGVGTFVDRRTMQVRKRLPSGREVVYSLDAAGKVSAIALDGSELVGAIEYLRTVDGLTAKGFAFGNGLRTTKVYGDDGMLSVHATGTEIFSLKRDGNQRITSVERRAGLTRRPAAALFGEGWLALINAAKASAPTAQDAASTVTPMTRVLGYDARGRLETEHIGGQEHLRIGYNALGDRQAMDQQYDGAGNLGRLGGMTLRYSDAGHLLSVVAADGSVLGTYRYDADGMRIAKQTGKGRRHFLYDDGQLLAEADGDGRIMVEYVYLGRRPIARLRHDRDTDSPGSTIVEYLHADHRNAVVAVTDQKQNIVWHGVLDSFGELAEGSGVRSEMPLRLSGQYDDAESGLHYNVYRYYAPKQGRYVQADPLGLAAGPNFYAYVDNDPLTRADPLGLDSEPSDPLGGGPGGGAPEWLVGILVHNQFTAQVRALGPGYGGNDGRSGTWVALRPDAYYAPVIAVPKVKNPIWELKPISWEPLGFKRTMAIAQVAGYVASATKGCWKPGSSLAIFEPLPIKTFNLQVRGFTYAVQYSPDAVKDSDGLIFYAARAIPNKKVEVPKIVPAPVLSEEEEKKLKASFDKFREIAAAAGWALLKIIGWIVLIALAIAAMIFLAVVVSVVVAAIIEVLALLFAAVTLGQLALGAGLMGVFGISAAQDANAEKLGEQKQKGLLDSTIGWFKSWF